MGPGVAPKVTRTEHAMGLMSSVDPEWPGDDGNASTIEGSLPRTVTKSRGEVRGGTNWLSLQERSRLKQFTVLDGLLFYTPQQGGNPVTRLCA